MRSPSPTPALVPDHDLAVHIVLDDFGRAGLVYREAAPEYTTRAAVIKDIITGQYNDPSRVVAFNTAEGWARDVTEDVAREIQERSQRAAEPLDGAARTFVERELG
jgi:hypothetical protein